MSAFSFPKLFLTRTRAIREAGILPKIQAVSPPRNRKSWPKLGQRFRRWLAFLSWVLRGGELVRQLEPGRPPQSRHDFERISYPPFRCW